MSVRLPDLDVEPEFRFHRSEHEIGRKGKRSRLQPAGACTRRRLLAPLGALVAGEAAFD